MWLFGGIGPPNLTLAIGFTLTWHDRLLVNRSTVPCPCIHVTIHVHLHVHVSQDTLPALGFKTYFIRTSTNETVLKGARIARLTHAKRIAQEVDEDIPMENDVSAWDVIPY